MLPSNMLLLNLIPLIDVTFSTPTGHYTSVRFSFAFFGVNECNGDFSTTTVRVEKKVTWSRS
jgi:hypothetical protein